MTSFLSALSISGIAFDLYGHMVSREETCKLMTTFFKEGRVQPVIRDLIKKSILSILDINMPEDKILNTIMNDKELTLTEKATACMTVVLTQYCEAKLLKEFKLDIILTYLDTLIPSLLFFADESKIQTLQELYIALVDGLAVLIIVHLDEKYRKETKVKSSDLIKKVNDTLEYQSPNYHYTGKRKRDDSDKSNAKRRKK